MQTAESYFRHHGLGRDPFPDSSDELYFITPELNGRLELIASLLQHGSRVAVITAPAGGGKTALAGYLGRHPRSNWLPSSYTAGPDSTPGELLRRILPGGPRAGAAAEAVRGFVHEYLQECGRENDLLIAVIDDAQELPADSLDLILRLASEQADGSGLHFLLLGREILRDQLHAAAGRTDIDGAWQLLALPEFPLPQTRAYIEYRLAASGTCTTMPMTAQTMDDIHKVSGGRPGYINRLARQAMQDPGVFGPGGGGSNTHQPGLPRYRLPALAATAVLLAVLMAVFIFREFRAGAPDAVASLSSADLNGAGYTEPTASSPGPAGRPWMMTAPDNAGAGKPGPEPASPPDGSEVALPHAPGAGADLRSGSFPGVKDSNWLRQQPPDRYVLQLIGARDMATIHNFLDAQPEIAADSTLVAADNAGSPWFILLYGLYDNREQAVAGIAGLPELARRQNPWARPIAGITWVPAGR